MVYIPLIYFLLFTLYLYKRQNSFDVPCFMAALYTITSFFACVIVECNLFESGGVLCTDNTLSLGIVPTILYCGLHTVCIMPFTRLKIRNIEEIYIVNSKVFDYFCYMLILIGAINLLLVFDSVIGVIKDGDLLAVRAAHYEGENAYDEILKSKAPKLVQYFLYLNPFTKLALPCFFYSLLRNKHWFFKMALLATSLTMPLLGTLAADRAQIIAYAQSVCLCLLIFWPLIDEKSKRVLKKVFCGLACVSVVYIASVTFARWESSEGGSLTALVQYSGQSYLNFCYFFENMREGSVHIERVLPILSKISGGETDASLIKEIKSAEHGFFVGVFPSYLGVFLLDVGVWGLLLWCVCFVILSYCTIKPNGNRVSFGEILWYCILATIPIFGIFYYPYFTWLTALPIPIGLVLLIIFKYRFVMCSK